MYCSKCGRLIEGKQCTCLKTKVIRRMDALLIYISLIFFPMFLIVRRANIKGIDNVNYFFIVSVTLAVILSFLTILTIITKKSYLALFFGCHQKIDRSFTLNKRVMGICSRCFGIYCGVFLSLLIFVYFESVWMIILVIPLVFDGVMQEKTSYNSNNTTRFITGILFGVSFVYLFAQYNYFIFTLFNSLMPVFHIS